MLAGGVEYVDVYLSTIVEHVFNFSQFSFLENCSICIACFKSLPKRQLFTK